ncbi:MAG: aldo/keto reductase [Anaerolineae bacterium]
MDRALDVGFNFLDTANVYNAERASRSSARRAAAQRQARPRRAGDQSVQQRGRRPQRPRRLALSSSRRVTIRCRLRTDHIDLYQLHRPSAIIRRMRRCEGVRRLIRAGKVLPSARRPAAWKVMEALAISARHIAHYISEQPPYNLLDRRIENELVPLCQQYGLALPGRRWRAVFSPGAMM